MLSKSLSFCQATIFLFFIIGLDRQAVLEYKLSYPAHCRRLYFHCHSCFLCLFPVCNQLLCSPKAPLYHCHYGLNFSKTNIETHMPASPFFPILGTIQIVSPSLGFTPVCLLAFLVILKSFEKPKSLYNSLRNTAEYKQLSKSSVLILKRVWGLRLEESISKNSLWG